MEDQQKTRLLILALAGLMLVGGGTWWVISQNNAADKAEEQANSSLPTTAPAPAATAPAPAATAPAPAATASAPAATAPDSTAASPAPAAATPAKSGLQNLAGIAPDTEEPLPVNTSQANNLIASAVTPSAPVQSTPSSPGKYSATRREEAISAAKQVAGREDPMMGTFQKNQYPSPWTKLAAEGGRTTIDDANEEAEKTNKEKKTAKGENLVPPPPPKSEKPIPPPPPGGLGGGSVAEAPSLPIDILPQPPDKPLVTPSLKLAAIVGDRAILQVPLAMRMQNHWPATISLAKNERFEDPNHGSFSVVSVDRDSVTIEEEQERSVKTLPQIR